MSVKAPGYYTSWLHVVTEIKENLTNVDLYEWMKKWTKDNYGHEWNNESKKLNAIITINSSATLSASKFVDKTLNENILASEPKPALKIPTSSGPGVPGFRSYDRITIINNGKIIGAYADRNYGKTFSPRRTGSLYARSGPYFTGEGSFKPPKTIEQHGVVRRHKVNSVNLQVAGGGGSGGPYDVGGTVDSIAGCGGGGGGAGGRCTQEDVFVFEDVEVTSSGGGAGNGTSYSQVDIGSLAAASPGGAGGKGTLVRRSYYCKGWDFFGCGNPDHHSNDGKGGKGGKGGSNLKTGTKNGDDGGDGGMQSQIYASSGCQGTKGFGGSGGGGVGGAGGKGGEAHNKCGGYPIAPTSGESGWSLYNFKQLQLFGPAISNYHTNVRIINNGVIAGGYNDFNLQSPTPLYAIYGANLVETHPTWGTVYSPSSPGYTNNTI